MDDKSLERNIDRLEANVAHLEDTLATIYDEILRLRVDVASLTSRFDERWDVVGVEWKAP